MKSLLLSLLMNWHHPIPQESLSVEPMRLYHIAQCERGIASYYHSSLHGNLTASGSRFDASALTVAHRQLPFGTRVRVVNLYNSRSVDCTVTDRGPFIDGRIIDLSPRAAGRLGMKKQGLAMVEVHIL